MVEASFLKMNILADHLEATRKEEGEMLETFERIIFQIQKLQQ